MKLRIDNLGYIQRADICTRPLTIVCGKNNTGKTYLSYTIYGLLSFMQQARPFQVDHDVLDNLSQKGAARIDLAKYTDQKQLMYVFQNISEQFSQHLDRVFSSPEGEFATAKVTLDPNGLIPDLSPSIKNVFHVGKRNSVTVNKLRDSTIVEVALLNEENAPSPPEHILSAVLNRVLCEMIVGSYFKNPFVITSERTGIQLFSKELDIRKNEVLDTLVEGKGKIADPFDLIDKFISRYPIAIKDNIDYIRDHERLRKTNSFLLGTPGQEDSLFEVWGEIMGGKLNVIANQLVFVPRERVNRKQVHVPIYLGSSAIKSQVSLDLYLRHNAQPDDMLMIDEPELNLHPDNQRLMARLLARLVNKGINVFITTHSDYILKEINNLLLLANQFPTRKALMRKYGYTEDEVLKNGSTGVYVMRDHKAQLVEITSTGMELSVFDEIIINQNGAADEIYYGQKE
ncbi:MAG: AAA family ATPase [Candidatus Aminicenantes bacterium]|nr:AAA family ATPase [Candidatus Aminicenantes bacterium]